MLTDYAAPKVIGGVACSEVCYQVQRLRIAGFTANITDFHSHVTVRRDGHLYGSLSILEGEFVADDEVTAIVRQGRR